jgi:hypothetical protein
MLILVDTLISGFSVRQPHEGSKLAGYHDGGTEKGGQNGREKGASTAVTLWPLAEVAKPQWFGKNCC